MTATRKPSMVMAISGRELLATADRLLRVGFVRAVDTTIRMTRRVAPHRFIGRSSASGTLLPTLLSAEHAEAEQFADMGLFVRLGLGGPNDRHHLRGIVPRQPCGSPAGMLPGGVRKVQGLVSRGLSFRCLYFHQTA